MSSFQQNKQTKTFLPFLLPSHFGLVLFLGDGVSLRAPPACPQQSERNRKTLLALELGSSRLLSEMAPDTSGRTYQELGEEHSSFYAHFHFRIWFSAVAFVHSC